MIIIIFRNGLHLRIRGSPRTKAVDFMRSSRNYPELVRMTLTIYITELAIGGPTAFMELQVQFAGQNTILR